VIGIHIPPLRERRSDIPLLARHLLDRIAPEMELTDAALERLVSHEFRGNVRELGNVLERSAAFAESSRVDAGDIHFGSAPVPADVPLASAVIEAAGALGAPAGAAGLNINGTLPEYLDGIEREVIESALTQTRFNRTAAAELLGITLRQLRYRMQRLNIQ